MNKLFKYSRLIYSTFFFSKSLPFKTYLERILLFFICTITVLLILNRLTYGVDFTDEALYSSLAMAFSRGYRPFADELMIGQGFAVLASPLTYLLNYSGIGTEGIVLNFRLLYLTLAAALSVGSFAFLRRHLDLIISGIYALLLLCFWPFGIPSISYNTLSTILFSSGLLLLYSDIDKKRTSTNLPIALLFFAASIFSYPPLLGPAILAIGLFGHQSRRTRLPSYVKILSLVVLLSLFTLAIWLIYFKIGIPRIEVMFDYLNSFGRFGGGTSKLLLVKNQLIETYTLPVSILLILFTSYFFIDKSPIVSLLIAILLPARLFLCPFNHPTIPAHHLLISCLSIFALTISIINYTKGKIDAWDAISIISFFCGLSFTWSSSNGISNFGVGCSICILSFGVKFHSRGINTTAGRITSALIASSLLVYTIKFLCSSTYGEGPINTLTTQIETGPYRGLYTSPLKSAFLTQLSNDLKKIKTIETKTIAFYYSFPAGYLLTDLHIAAPTVIAYSFSQTKYDRNQIISYYRNPATLPDVLVWMKGLMITDSNHLQLKDSNDILRTFLTSQYRIKLERSLYTVYEKVNAREQQ